MSKQRERAMGWLRDALANGSQLRSDIEREAQAVNIRLDNLRWARNRLGVECHRMGVRFGHGGRQEWRWTLPVGENR